MRSRESRAAAKARGWRRLLVALAIDIRPGEGRAASFLFLYNALLFAAFYAGKAVRQSTFVDNLGAAALPYAYLLVALGSFPVVRLYTALADRLSGSRLIIVWSTGLAVGLVLFWWILRIDGPAVPLLFYLWITLVFSGAISQFWSFANQTFDPRQARRLFGLLGGGASVGGIAGGQIARLTASGGGTGATLLAVAGLVAAIAMLMVALRRVGGTAAAKRADGASVELRAARRGLGGIHRARAVQQIAGVMILTVAVSQIVDLQFNWVVEQKIAAGQRTAAFGNFYSLMGVGAFFFQVLVTPRIHRAFGVGTAMRVLPVTMGLGTLAFMAAGIFFAPLLLPAAWALKIGEGGLRHSFDQVTRELLFLPIPSALRVKAKAFIDVFVQRFAEGLAALLLLTVTFGLLSPLGAGWLTLFFVIAWIGLTVFVRRSYVAAYRKRLESGELAEVASLDLSDVGTIESLVRALGSTDGRRVLHSIDLLDHHGRAGLVTPWLLHHGDPEVRRRTLEVLGHSGRRDAVAFVESALSDSDPQVRSEAIRALATLLDRDATALMQPRLAHADPGVRAAAVACLTNHGTETMRQEASDALGDMLSDADPAVRIEAARAISEVPEPTFEKQLVRLLYDDSPEVVREAIAAITRRLSDGSYNPLYVPVLVALTRDRRLKHDCREALAACGEAVVPALAHFMNDQHETLWVRRAVPKTIARISGATAVRALEDGLEIRDDFLRRKVIEAICALRSEHPDVLCNLTTVEREIRREAWRYLRHLADLWSLASDLPFSLEGPLLQWLSPTARPPLVLALLAERMRHNAECLFELLALLYPVEDMRAAYRSSLSGLRSRRSHALEYLDNTLAGDVRRYVFAVVDDTPLAERLRQANRLFGIRVDTPTQTLRRLIAEDRGDEGALAAAAIYAVYQDRVTALYPQVNSAVASASEPFIRETAGWVVARLDPTGRQVQEGGR